MTEDLELILGPGGLVATRSEGYEDRPQQREMARRVADALTERHHLVVEAGTGTGKTLAYLVPAILSERKVVVSTATRALQDQIFYKDLPFLRRTLGIPFHAALLKGRGNYVCRLRLARFAEQPVFPFRAEAAQWETVRAWTAQTATGDRAEVEDVAETWSGWPEIVSSSETCIGQRCAHYEDCFVMAARAEAAAADLVVVNHHLFFADLALRTSEAGRLAGAEVIPRYDAVVFDEAHAVEDVATTFFGQSISSYRTRDLARDAGRIAAANPGLARALGEAATRLEGRSAAFFQGLRLPEGRARVTPAAFEPVDGDLARLLEGLEVLAAVAGSGAEGDDEVAALERRARELYETLEAITAQADPDQVYWSEVRGAGTFLHASPIDVAAGLRDRLLRRVDTCVVTSATLATNQDFAFFKARTGLADDPGEGGDRFDLDEVILPSPFDYETQAALYVPETMPEPSDPAFAAAVADEVVALCELTGGRAFVLCTSHRNLRAIHGALAGRLAWPLLRQGDAPKGALLDRFRRTPSVLVATQSFWEGVDVPGEALSLVVIDKLPFASPGDPVVAARLDAVRRRGRSPFDTLQLPQAALALKQGFGRLVRTRRDRGIVAICDVRLATRAYRAHFIRTLPPCPRFRDRAGLSDWWQRGAD